jgi:small multidrug resistance pump
VPMGIAYAVWAGAGIVLIAISGAIFFKQLPDLPAVLGMLFIIVGVVLVSAVSRTAGH